MGDRGRASQPHRSLPFGHESLSGLSRVRSAGRALESQPQPTRVRSSGTAKADQGGEQRRHQGHTCLQRAHLASVAVPRPLKESRPARLRRLAAQSGRVHVFVMGGLAMADLADGGAVVYNALGGRCVDTLGVDMMANR